MPDPDRYAPCPCGSGMQFPDCHGKLDEESQSMLRAGHREPYVVHVPSVFWRGRRARVTSETVHLRPAAETFHEFLLYVVMQLLGERWYKQQKKTPLGSRHVVLKWLDAWSETSRRTPSRVVGKRYAVVPSGPAFALLALGYDLYCLQVHAPPPESFVERLRRNKGFQSVRHEIAAAACVSRAGFHIEYLDAKPSNERHCEFVATCKSTGIRFAVEAKSRVRPGVLHEPGDFAYEGDVRGLLKLLRTAGRQTVDRLPLIIFLDVNMPPTPNTPPPEKPWVHDLMAAADEVERRTEASGGVDQFALLVATNLGFHFGSAGGEPAPTEYGFVVGPKRPGEEPEQIEAVRRIVACAQTMARVPDEV